MTADGPGHVTQHCECGNDTYYIKTPVDRSKVWAECAECGRPTGVVGDGLEKQLQWYSEND